MNYAIELTDIALQEEAEAYLFYENKSEGLGERFLKAIESALHKVSQHPTHYSYIDGTKTIRDIALERFPFVIIFEVIKNKIIIYHIHHTKKKL